MLLSAWEQCRYPARSTYVRTRTDIKKAHANRTMSRMIPDKLNHAILLLTIWGQKYSYIVKRWTIGMPTPTEYKPTLLLNSTESAEWAISITTWFISLYPIQKINKASRSINNMTKWAFFFTHQHLMILRVDKQCS
jgi:hypothetical protein